ncbi:MAG: hypothetical protein R3C02_13285 [Planctomycetaceae bacterium]
MGSEPKLTEDLTFEAASPLPATFKLLRNGEEVTTTVARTFEYQPTKPGNYRLELWVNLPDGPQIWALSNPLYISD